MDELVKKSYFALSGWIDVQPFDGGVILRKGPFTQYVPADRIEALSPFYVKDLIETHGDWADDGRPLASDDGYMYYRTQSGQPWAVPPVGKHGRLDVHFDPGWWDAEDKTVASET